MAIDPWKLYSSKNDFFRLSGNAIMRLTGTAAEDVCNSAAAEGMLILRVEGGFHDTTGFEARLDCIWNGKNHACNLLDACKNNSEAAKFVKCNSDNHNAFIITVDRIE